MQRMEEQFSKYDVLLGPPILGMSAEYSLVKHEDHVGNQRFHVLLTMNQEAYTKAYEGQISGECDRIVDQLVDTVCNQVVPKGRFLVSQSVLIGNAMPTMQWVDMETTAVKKLLHQILKPPGPDVALSSANMFSKQLSESQMPSSSPPPPMPQDLADDGHKRRRRSSLLRRSNSETMVGMVLDNRKKLHYNNGTNPRRGITQEEPAFWKSSTSVTERNRMDVVFAPTRDALDPSCMSVGNNRLHILFAVRKAQFRGGGVEEQEKILDEMLETVATFWKGRFLVEIEGGYDEVPRGEAREVMRIILAGQTQQQANQARRQRHSAPVMAMKNSGILASAFGNLRHSFGATSIAPPALIEDAQKNQSKALQDLKKAKMRLQNANRLQEKFGATTKNEGAASQSSAHPGMGQGLFPLGGGNLRQPSIFGPGTGRVSDFASSMSRTSTSRQMRPRESTVFSKVDKSVMEQLVAELDEADCNDDLDEPLPVAQNMPFGNQYGSFNRGDSNGSSSDSQGNFKW